MEVSFMKLAPEAKMPRRQHRGDAGLDMYCTRIDFDIIRGWVFHTDIAIEIPKGHVGLLFPRSSVCSTRLSLSNSVGVIDSGYRGEITFVYDINFCRMEKISYDKGDRIGQLIIIPYPHIEMREQNELSVGDRGLNGYRSTNLK